jgi:hypothetical protein
MLRALRRRVLTPNPSAALMAERGFHVKSPEGKELLETIGQTFLTGYAYAAEAKAPADAEERLEQIPTRFRGFAYEGAGMAYAIRDGLPIGGSKHFAGFLEGRAANHEYMAWIGLGWALARLPRFRWSRFVVEDPLMRWLVLDGYGFHQAYFKTDKYVHRQYREPDFPWPGGPLGWYADRAIDQGIGRALWFVGGTDPELVAELIGRFGEDRRPDLYAGAGLAATYAGGVDEGELRRFWKLAEKYRSEVRQGAAFAATARSEAGLMVPHTVLALKMFCGLAPEDAERLCREARPRQAPEGDIPAFEVWRRRIAEAIASPAQVDP